MGTRIRLNTVGVRIVVLNSTRQKCETRPCLPPFMFFNKALGAVIFGSLYACYSFAAPVYPVSCKVF